MNVPLTFKDLLNSNTAYALYKNWEKDNIFSRDEDGNKTIKLDTEAAFVAGWNAAAALAIDTVEEICNDE